MPHRFKKWSTYTPDNKPLGYVFARDHAEALGAAKVRWPTRCGDCKLVLYQSDRGWLGWLFEKPAQELPPWLKRGRRFAS